MNEKHTIGRLQAIHDRYLTIVGTGERIGRCGAHGPHAANARRLAACWNACETIPTEVLEGGDAGVLAYSIKLEAQRDRLLALAEMIVNASWTPEEEWPEVEEAPYNAIAYVTGSVDDVWEAG